MPANNQSFSDDLDRLINLFKKIKEKMNQHQYQSIDKTFMQNIDMMVTNYETIRGNISPDMLNSMGEPIHKMMTLLMEQINAEYGDILGEEFKVVEAESISQKSIADNVEIEHIDTMLHREGLKTDEIDKLLDLRAELKLKQQQQIEALKGNNQ